MRTTASLLLVLSALASAQPVPGDIGATAFSSSEMALIDGSGVASTINVGNFQGSGTSQAILWDPMNSNSFIVGGFGFVGRVDLSGGGATYTLLTNNIGTACQMSWDPTDPDRIIVADAGNDGIVGVDAISGAVTPIAPSGPWGSTLNAGFIHPSTSDIYVGNNGSIYRIPAGGGAPVLFASGWSASTSYVSGLTADPATNEIVATLLSVNRVARFDAAGNPTDLVPAGSISSPNSIAVDMAGDFVVGGRSRQVWSVPAAGGSASLIGSFTASGSSCSGVTVVGVGGPSGPPEFQTNTPKATLLLDNLAGTSANPATVNSNVGDLVPWSLSTNVAGGAIFDVAISTRPLVPRSGGGVTVTNGDILNVDFTDPNLALLNGLFTTPVFLTTLSGTFAAVAPSSTSFQMGVLDPSSPGGLVLSQPTVWDVN